jgi:alpha-1,2-mannosyltransferase
VKERGIIIEYRLTCARDSKRFYYSFFRNYVTKNGIFSLEYRSSTLFKKNVKAGSITNLIVMKILVVHPYFREVGGAEQVFLHTVDALTEKKKEVTILSELPKHDGEFKEISKENVLNIPYDAPNFKLKKVQAYQKLLWQVFAKNRLRKRIGTAELEILTQDVMFLLNVGKRKVAYVHYPENIWHLENANKRFLNIWKIFYMPLLLYMRQQVKKIDVIFCNSEFTKKAIMRKWGREAKVIYPPVDVENFSPAKKEDFIVTVGRFVRTKNYELIVEVAKRIPQLKFIIIGRKQEHDTYYQKIKKSKPSNLILATDLSTAEMSSLLSKARLYLHTMIGEHFGISVVEAMASGCIPIVHNSGGTREVIGNFGYIYNDLDECIDCIFQALKSTAKPEKIAEHSTRFSSVTFKNALIENLEKNGFL